MNADVHLNLETLNQSALKRAMGCFVTGIAVVTTRHEGVDFGMTCNSFNTVSLDPPLVLWSVQRSASSYEAFTRSGGYAVSILDADQDKLVRRFTHGPQEERFAGLPLTRLESGRVVLDGAVAWFDCSLEKSVSAGDQDVLIGRVLDFASQDDGSPLGYGRGEFKAF